MGTISYEFVAMIRLELGSLKFLSDGFQCNILANWYGMLSLISSTSDSQNTNQSIKISQAKVNVYTLMSLLAV